MSFTANEATNQQDPDRAACYAAEDAWVEATGEDDYMPQEQVAGYLLAALEAVGWEVGEAPGVVFDIPEESHLAGMHRGSTSGTDTGRYSRGTW